MILSDLHGQIGNFELSNVWINMCNKMMEETAVIKNQNSKIRVKTFKE